MPIFLFFHKYIMDKEVKFIKTVSSEHISEETGELVTLAQTQEDNPGAIIHVKDEYDSQHSDNQLYIGEDRITDNFNISNPALMNVSTLKVGSLRSTTFGELNKRSISDILIEMLKPITVETVTITGAPSGNLRVGGTAQLGVVLDPIDVTDSTVTWSSENTSVATVDQSGKVTAVGLGTTTITATVGGGEGTCTITVEATPVTGVSLNKTSITLTSPNATQTLTVTVSPSNATDKSVTWSSLDTNVATVSSSGVVSAVDVGTTTITVRTVDGDKTKTCTVTVEGVYKKLSGGTNPSVSMNYIGSLDQPQSGVMVIGSDETFPTTSDFSYTSTPGSWKGGTQFDGTVTENPFTITQTSEGVYTVSGSVTFGASSVPVDNFNHEHPEEQYQGGTVNASNPITIKVFDPVYINGYYTDGTNDVITITEVNRYLFDYNEGIEMEITTPAETYDDKFVMYLPDEFDTVEVWQYDEFAKDYTSWVGMEISPDVVSEYPGYKKYVRSDNSYTNRSTVKYKINLEK